MQLGAQLFLIAQRMMPLFRLNVFQRHQHYFWLAAAAAILLAISVASFDYLFINGMFAGTVVVGLAYLIIIGSVTHTAIWMALGGGNTPGRIAIAFGLFSIVLAGGIAGMSLLLFKNQREDIWPFAATALLGSPAILAAAQIPLWLVRGIFGWQILHETQQRIPISIREMFAITLIYAVAFAMPAAITNFFIQRQNIQAGSEVVVYQEDSPGNFNGEFVPVTDENLDEIRVTEAQRIREGTNAGLLGVAVTAMVISMVTLPIIWITFRSRLRYAAMLGGLVYLILAAIIMLTANNAPAESMYFLALAIIGWLATACGPLYLSKSNGFELKAGRKIPISAMNKN